MMKLLEVNLTEGAHIFRDFPEKMIRRYLGGFGFNTWYLYHHLPAGTDPLGPENILLLSPGLLTGTAAPASSRLHISALSPLSGLMGSSNAGGFFGPGLHRLSIGGVILKGRSERPVCLHIDPEGVRLLPAEDLWGLDTAETLESVPGLIRRHTSFRELADPAILAIGPAGENLVRYACIMAGHDHAAGRTGLGAVMGSKKLKALSVSAPGGILEPDFQSAEPVKAAPTARKAVRAYLEGITKSSSRYSDFSRYGSAGDILEMSEQGVLGLQNYRRTGDTCNEKVDGRYLRRFLVKKTTCHRCPVGCKAEIELPGGDGRLLRGARPEYETIINLGLLCGIDDPAEILFLSNLCDRLGLDSISAGSAVAFAMDLYGRNILTDRETRGLRLVWGDQAAMERLLRKIAGRLDFGDLLAEGVKRAAERIGGGAEKYAYTVKNVEIYGVDPRGMMGTALAYAVSLRGGDFTSVYPVPEFRYSPARAEREFGTEEAVVHRSIRGKGALAACSMVVSAVIDSLGLCKVPSLSISGNFDLEKEAALVTALTGIVLSPQELKAIGRRILAMGKLFNIRFGAGPEDDTLPKKFLKEPVPRGPSAGNVVDLEPMIRDFYSAMGWDERGTPPPAGFDF